MDGFRICQFMQLLGCTSSLAVSCHMGRYQSPQVLHSLCRVVVYIDCNHVCIDCNVCEAHVWHVEIVLSLVWHSSCSLLICLSTHSNDIECLQHYLHAKLFVCHRLGMSVIGLVRAVRLHLHAWVSRLGPLQISPISGPHYNYCLLLLLPCTAGGACGPYPECLQAFRSHLAVPSIGEHSEIFDLGSDTST